ncbi:MAG: carbohydrate ABC transporter substrate-binding protein [Roseburia sp.]|nr:carbohydrate ABC transporter substrate-binding protein [Roseburia sp.]
MKKKIISALLCVSMVATMVAGCGGSSDTTSADNSNSGVAATATESGSDAAETDTTGDEGKVFNIYCWNEEFKSRLTDHYPGYEEVDATTGKIGDVTVKWNITPSDDNAYQNNLDATLLKQESAAADDKIDLFLVEADYALKYVNTDYTMSVADLGITADDYANSYQYNLDLGSDVDGNVRALFWQATPGCYAVRADLAEKYLGTTDPAALAEKFKDLDTIVATAKEVNDASGGKCKLFSGYDEIKRSLTGSRTQGFYDENDKITIDDNIKTYMETAKTLYDEDLTFNTDQWSADWSANMSGDGVDSNAALAYMGCPWFVYWSLSDAWKGNTILVPTQTKCYWGGTGLAATTDCADTELAAKIMKFFTCDEDGMVAINALNSDYVNNTAAVSKIIEAGTSADGNGYLYPDAGQNFMEFFLPLADGLDASMVTAEDQQILSLMDTQTKAYATGEKDLDTALADLTASIHDTFSYLSAE